MTGCVSVSTLRFAIKQFVSRFNCCLYKSLPNPRTKKKEKTPLETLTALLIIFKLKQVLWVNNFFYLTHETPALTELIYGPGVVGDMPTTFYTPPWTFSNKEWNITQAAIQQADAFAGSSSLLRRLFDFYEYAYTAQSGGGFVFISLLTRPQQHHFIYSTCED